MGALVEQLAFDSDTVPEGQRFGLYRDLYSGGADAHCLGPCFRATVSACQLDRSLLFERRLREVAHERDPQRVRRNGFDHFTLTLNLDGEFHADDGDGFRLLRPGEILMLDMTRAMRTRAPDAHILTMSVARDRIEEAGVPVDRAHGRMVKVERAAYLADHMISIARRRSSLRLSALSTLARVTTELLALAAGEGGRRKPRNSAHPRHADAIRLFIERNLGNPSLDVGMIAAGTHVSRATLYRHFACSGGIAAFIRARRLDALRRALADPMEKRTIAQLAEWVGFADEGAASRRFSETFGLRPGRYRQMVRGGHPLAASHSRLSEWVLGLR